MLTITVDWKTYTSKSEWNFKAIYDILKRDFKEVKEESEEKVTNSSTIPNSSDVSKMETVGQKIDLPSIPDFDYTWTSFNWEYGYEITNHATESDVGIQLEKLTLWYQAIVKYLEQFKQL